MKSLVVLGAAVTLSLLAGSHTAHAGAVLDRVKAAGVLQCGVNREDVDEGKEDTHGNIAEFGLDICRAVAAAVLGDASKIAIVSGPDDHHGIMNIINGKTDLLVGLTPDSSTVAAFKLGFGPTIFFDGQGFLVPKNQGITEPRDLAGKTVCYISETDAEPVLRDTFAAEGIKEFAFPFEERGEMEAALTSGHCAAITADVSDLANMRTDFHAWVDRFAILPQQISRDPVAPAYSPDDAQWAAIVNWTIYALINAEELGVTAATVGSTNDDPGLRRLRHATAALGQQVGLDDAWALRAIKAVGNYGEIFNRDLGDGSELKLARGQNELAAKGGLIYAMPMR